MKRKDFIKQVLIVLTVPALVLLGYAIAGSGGFSHLWPFLLGYLVGVVYYFLLHFQKAKQ